MRKPPGTICEIGPYDTHAEVAADHYIISSGGSCYRVIDPRRSRKNPHRWYLTCERVRPGDIPRGATRHALYWNSRNKKKGG